MSYGNNWGGELSSPFALLWPSSSSIFFWDEKSESINVKSVIGTTTTSTTETLQVSYVEGAQVHDGPVGINNSGGIGWREQGTTEKYFRGFALTKSSSSGIGAYYAPNGDDICISFGKSHQHIKDGLVGPITPTTCIPEKCHALVIALGVAP